MIEQSLFFDSESVADKPEKPTLREYQQEAVDAGLSVNNGLLVLPTGSGKSHVIAELVNRTDGKSIILQPTKEILESNLDKIQRAGFRDVAVYSASMGEKRLAKASYATIGSIIKIKDYLTDIELLIVDEAHLTNAQGGMYFDFIEALKPKRIIGLTATPYRLHSNSWGSFIRMLTRTRPKIWDDIVHITQSRDLIEQGFLVEPEFIVSGQEGMGLLRTNTTGAEYSEDSIERYSRRTDLSTRIADAAEIAIQRRGLKHLLIFVNSLAQNQLAVDELKRRGITADSISGKTPKAEREFKLKAFRSGEIKAILNVGCLTTGYDFPRLDCIIGGRPTMSLGLGYQMIGRGVRPHPDKTETVIYDLVNNYEKFGNPFDMMIVRGSTGLCSVMSSKGRLTGRCIEDEAEIYESPGGKGKYSRTPLRKIPTDFMEWYLGNAKKNAKWHMFDNELIRRNIFNNNGE